MSKENISKEKYKDELKYLHKLTEDIEQAIYEGGVRGNVAKDGLSSHFNDRLDKLILKVYDQTREETIREMERDLEGIDLGGVW